MNSRLLSSCHRQYDIEEQKTFESCEWLQTEKFAAIANCQDTVSFGEDSTTRTPKDRQDFQQNHAHRRSKVATQSHSP